MGRTRSIRPGFFLNEKLAEVEPLGRLLFAGLWTIADKRGRVEDRPRRIQAELLPYDDCDVDNLLNELSTGGFIHRYIVNGERYIEIVNFEKHQHCPGSEAESTIPASNDAGAQILAHSAQDIAQHAQDVVPVSCISYLVSCKKDNANALSHARARASECEEDREQGEEAGTPPLSPEESPALSQKEPLPRAEEEPSATVERPAPMVKPKLTVPAPTAKDRIRERFAEFWATYPKKQGKGAAEKAFLKISPTAGLHETMIAAIRAAVLSRQWREQNGRFIPNPATWLNQRRWEDTLPVETMDCPQIDAADRVIAMLEQREGEAK